MAMVSTLIAMAPALTAMVSNLAMASHLIAMASNLEDPFSVPGILLETFTRWQPMKERYCHSGGQKAHQLPVET